MALQESTFLDAETDLFLTYVGMETDLIFNQGIDLPGFASFPLLETTEGRMHLQRYMKDMIALGEESGAGIILESPTWVANRDRAAALGYTPADLKQINKDAIALLANVRDAQSTVPIIMSANVGPRHDAYARETQMSALEAEQYHAEQVSALVDTAVDVVSGYTFACPVEATGLVEAAKHYQLPVVISFTVETDGALPTGSKLEAAIDQVDTATDGYVSYFMINCAHPEHFASELKKADWMKRIQGFVANASRCSHAELDQAETLDAGNPTELAQQLAKLRTEFPHIRVLGGCCGTDMRHMTQIAKSCMNR